MACRLRAATVMLGLFVRSSWVRLVKAAKSVAGKGQCMLKLPKLNAVSLPWGLQLSPETGGEQKSVTAVPFMSCQVGQTAEELELRQHLQGPSAAASAILLG
jgi:hypothetical protein